MTEKKNSWLKKHAEAIIVGILVFLLTITLSAYNKQGTPETVATPKTLHTTSKPISITKSGHGPIASDKFQLKKGLAIVKTTYNGAADVFVADLVDNTGESVGTVTNDGSAASASGTVQIPEDGQYLFDITYLGDWTVTITQD